MQDSNAKRGVRNDRRANNRGANAPKGGGSAPHPPRECRPRPGQQRPAQV